MKFSEKKLKEALKTIRMSRDERTAIRSTLQRHMNAYSKPIKSPFIQHAHRFVLRPMQVMTIMLVVLISSGTGLSYAANEALPGDPLYGFKIGITEELKTITMKDDVRANYEVTRAAKRLEETAQLALTGRLDHEAETVIREQLTIHTQKAQKFAQKASSEKPETPATVAGDINSELSARSQVLTEIKAIKQINGELTGILETTRESIDIAIQDEEDALKVLAANNEQSEVTIDRITEQRKKLDEKLALLEEFVHTPIENLESELEEIAIDLDTVNLESPVAEVVLEVEPSTITKVPVENSTEIDPVIKEKDVAMSDVTEGPIEEITIKGIEEIIVTLEDPSLIGNVTTDITLIRTLSDESYELETNKEYAKASAKLQEAIKRANNILTLIKLKEKYSTALEKELIITSEKQAETPIVAEEITNPIEEIEKLNTLLEDEVEEKVTLNKQSNLRE